MLYSIDTDGLGWFGAGGGLVALIVAAVAWVKSKIVGKTTLENRVNELTSKVFDLTDAHHKCEMENRDLKSELVNLQRHIVRLDKHAGLSTLTDPIQGIIISNLQGVIEEYSPALMVLLGWQRDDIIGKPISILIPPELLPLYKQKFDAFAADVDLEADPTRIIPTVALAKSKKRVSVFISLRTWPTANKNLITATVVERQIGVTDDAIEIPTALKDQ